MQREKRLCRYVMDTRDKTITLKPSKDVDILKMFVDSDWATDKGDGRSTSTGVTQFGGCVTFAHLGVITELFWKI